MILVDNALSALKENDPGLEAYFGDMRMHLDRYNSMLCTIAPDGNPASAANGYMYFGFHRTEEGWVFREWLPGADAVWLYGDFNNWSEYTHPLENIGNGIWEIKLKGKNALKHGQYIKLLVGRQGISFERIPAYIRYAVMDEKTNRLCGVIWSPSKSFRWSDSRWKQRQHSNAPLIYEAHIGMAQENGGIGTYREFADNTLEWIQTLGYNTIQLMAIGEHPYYASFGYQVTNFFAPSHRYGTPDDLKYLINKAHKMNIAVILDVVHSHACANEGEGLNRQDGTDEQYFLSGERGWHSAWKTRCFDYGKPEVVHFLLSNLKYWQEEFHFDGFRFDGVTSMLYENHGLGDAFTSYSQYYSLNTNVDARAYLTLANRLVHSVDPMALTIAEDMSGMPGMCLGVSDGGFGFDYRLSMGIPDMWIKLIKEQPMENWDVMYIYNELSGGRKGEKAVAYCESHDQALVGDKTIMFRLADAEMYNGMNKDYHTPSMDTAIDMHKLIRFLTLSLARDGYLDFMGNEFGHPEWIDFPREGNGWSYHYARRQWSLVKNTNLKFEWLANFDEAMIHFADAHKIHSGVKPEPIWLDQAKNLIIFRRGELIYAFNMHPQNSQNDVFINCSNFGMGDYKVVFSTDDSNFGGQDRISKDYVYTSQKCGYGLGFSMYLPCRTAAVIEKISKRRKAK